MCRGWIRVLSQALMDSEVAGLIAAERSERTLTPVSHEPRMPGRARCTGRVLGLIQKCRLSV